MYGEGIFAKTAKAANNGANQQERHSRMQQSTGAADKAVDKAVGEAVNTADNTTDLELVKAFQRRDQEVIARVDARYRELLLSICMNVLGSREDSEECLNDAYMRAWNSIPPDEPRNLRAYLAALCRAAAIDRYRYDRRQKRGGAQSALSLDELGDIVTAQAGTEDEAETAELAAALNRFLAEQSRREQIVFVKRYYFSEPVGQIAAETGCSQSTVYELLAGLRQKLRAALTKEGFL